MADILAARKREYEGDQREKKVGENLLHMEGRPCPRSSTVLQRVEQPEV